MRKTYKGLDGLNEFLKDLEYDLPHKLLSDVIEDIRSREFEFTCPECHHTFLTKTGKVICPSCGVISTFELDLRLDDSLKKYL